MADQTVESQGFRLKIHDQGDGTFLFTTHDGGAGVADQSLDVQGFRIQLHDNGDETFSPVTTPTTGGSDVQVELQGFRIRLRPTGSTITIGGQIHTLYAIVVFPV